MNSAVENAEQAAPCAGDALISSHDNRRMFEGIVARYDLLNRIMSLGRDAAWRRRAVDELAPADGDVILDLGCGTGDLCFESAARGHDVMIVGIDPVVEMISAARRKHEALVAPRDGRTPEAKHARIFFVVADGLNLPFRAGAFTGCVSGFCIRNITDHARAVAEFNRASTRDSRLSILELTTPHEAHPLVAALHRFVTGILVPLAGRLLSKGGAYSYLADSIRNFPDADAFCARLSSSGLDAVKAIPLFFGAVHVFTGRKK